MMANLVISGEQKGAIMSTKIAKVNEEVLPHGNQNYRYIKNNNFVETVMHVSLFFC